MLPMNRIPEPALPVREAKKAHEQPYSIDDPIKSPRALKSGLLKLDCFLLPVATIIYFLNFLDRSNIGNARAAGLQGDGALCVPL